MMSFLTRLLGCVIVARKIIDILESRDKTAQDMHAFASKLWILEFHLS